MRALAGLSLALAAHAAPDAWRDDFWGLAYDAPGFRRLLSGKDGDELLRGRADGGVRIDVRVREDAAPGDAAAARDAHAAALAAAFEDRETGTAPAPWLSAARVRYGAFRERHAWAFRARGFHVFVVHAWVREEGAGTDRALRAALSGLTLRDAPLASLALDAARRDGDRKSDDPELLTDVGRHYLRRGHAGLAVPALAAARAGHESLAADRRHELFRAGGGALRGTARPAEAAEWFLRAEEAARALPEETRDRAHLVADAAYQAARAFAAAGRLDDAFATLDRACTDRLPATKGALSNDDDLLPLRKDPRWHDFWNRRVAGK